MNRRLAIIATHPIQYYAPLFRCLAARQALELRVFYNWDGGADAGVMDSGFGLVVSWDVPLLEGYDYVLVRNIAKRPGTDHFRGLDNPELVAQVLDWRPDAVLVFGWAWKSHLGALRRLHGLVPVLFRGDSTLLGERVGPRRWLRRRWLHWVYRHVDIALYAGTHNREYYRAHGLRENQLLWAPHAVDNARFADPHGEHEAAARGWRIRLGIAAEEVVFLFVGKLEPKKSPADLLETFLSTDLAGAHLAYVGSGAQEPGLRARARHHPRVHFLGFQNQSRMPSLYRLGDVLVLPSRGPGETWGLAVNEAMASERPVMVSDQVGCAPDLVARAEHGRVFPAGDAASLAHGMVELASHPDLRTRLREEAARTIAAWSLTRLADAIITAAYQEE